MRTLRFISIWGLAALLLLAPAGHPVAAQEADEFSMPADSGASATPSDPGATPADPAETATTPAESPTETTGNAEDPGSGGSDEASPPAANLEEPEQVEILAGKFKFSPGNEAKDPFKPLVVKKVVLPPAPAPAPKPAGPAAPPPPPPPKPIQLFVSGICGNDNERLAMIMFENKPYVVSKDMVVDGKFKVVDILPDRLVIYSNKEQMRRTFPIGGGKE